MAVGLYKEMLRCYLERAPSEEAVEMARHVLEELMPSAVGADAVPFADRVASSAAPLAWLGGTTGEWAGSGDVDGMVRSVQLV